MWRAFPGLGALALLAMALPTVASGTGGLTSETVSSAACVPAGNTGLTTVMVARPGQTINGRTVNATGCDVGIYIGPGTNNVTIENTTITSSNDHGIFAEDASGLTVEHSTVTGNGVAPTPGIFDNKAIELVGMANSTIAWNEVNYNTGDGGIGVQDNGPLDSGAPQPGPSIPVMTHNIVIVGNDVSHNTRGCAIVVASHNPGGGVRYVTLADNNIVSTPFVSGPTGPEIGGIVIDAPLPNTVVSHVTVNGNTITGSLIAGIAVYAGSGPGAKVFAVSLTGNTLSGDGWGEVAAGRPKPEAIMVAAYPAPPGTPRPIVASTVITGNTITNEYYGEWLAYTFGTTSTGNSITTFPGGIPVYDVPWPGTGYWLASSTGQVYSFGHASNYGSAPSGTLTSPVVGIQETIDQAGYWLASANGQVLNFGDALPLGSVPSGTLTSPVVGMARTPYFSPGPGQMPQPGGEGYWLVTARGVVYNFGDAQSYGSLTNPSDHTPIVGIASTPDGHGYWLVAAHGGVYRFGDAGFYGSLGSQKLSSPIVGLSPTPDGRGYWLVAANGMVYRFGDTHFYGYLGSRQTHAPIVAMSSVGTIGDA